MHFHRGGQEVAVELLEPVDLVKVVSGPWELASLPCCCSVRPPACQPLELLCS